MFQRSFVPAEVDGNRFGVADSPIGTIALNPVMRLKMEIRNAPHPTASSRSCKYSSGRDNSSDAHCLAPFFQMDIESLELSMIEQNPIGFRSHVALNFIRSERVGKRVTFRIHRHLLHHALSHGKDDRAERQCEVYCVIQFHRPFDHLMIRPMEPLSDHNGMPRPLERQLQNGDGKGFGDHGRLIIFLSQRYTRASIGESLRVDWWLLSPSP